MKTLKGSHHELAAPLVQLQVIDGGDPLIPSFDEVISRVGLHPLTPTGIEILQVNVGKLCNQTCSHCHVDAGPDRTEVMTRATMDHCLDALRKSPIDIVDITGGAPELNPDFKWFVEQVRHLGRKVLVRSNLTVLTTRRMESMPRFFSRNQVTVISSLPCYTAENTDRQRGDGVFERSIQALRKLNSVGYGHPGTGLELNLVYNPGGPSLPPPQEVLKSDYKRVLSEEYGIVFNDLFCITNMPISRFLDSLIQQGKLAIYMHKLLDAFNPAAAGGVMCRNTLSVGWDGSLYDCDFNQMLDLVVNSSSPRHIKDFDLGALTGRHIVTRRHCFGCTAGAGSSCKGEIA